MVEARGGCWPSMDLFRSKAMQLVQLIIPVELAHLTVSYLGDLQFKDLNADKSPFHRTYAAQEQMEKAGVPPSKKSMTLNDIDKEDLEIKLGELKADLVEKASGFFSSAINLATSQQREMESHHSGEESPTTPLLQDQEILADSSKQVTLGFVTGLVPKEMSLASERIIFRATRGNVFIRQATVEEPVVDPISGEKIQDALQRASFDSNSQVGTIFQVLHTRESPATYFCTNKFTSTFQEIFDAYSIAKYQEANPGVCKIITFPFLFSIMFGDWGHGISLLLATLIFILREKKLSSQKLGDITEMPFGVRYVIIMMALFSIYTGLIYNEFFSVPFEQIGRSASMHVVISLAVQLMNWGENQLFPRQKIVQVGFILQLGCMLIFLANERHQGQSYTPIQGTEESLQLEVSHDSHDEEEFEFNEVLVHQMIHTIEFLPGAVSNTASYLRLWALSLAHDELSFVFYEKVLLLGWGFNNVIILIVGFIIFVFATVGVLLVT